MKPMLDLLIRLLEMRRCCQRVRVNPQLTDGEKAAAYCFERLVRDCLPAPVRTTYDRMEQDQADLLECPEVFAMAVLVTTYRQASPAGRRKLVKHFSVPEEARHGRGTHPVEFNARPRRNPAHQDSGSVACCE
jgi:hypothetical protein